MTDPVIGSAAAGFGAAIALIAAIGAQNAFVLRQGLRREHVPLVVAACAAADAGLIALGIAGLSAVVAGHPGAVTIARWAGAAFLLGYAGLAAHRALRPRGHSPTETDLATAGPATADRPTADRPTADRPTAAWWATLTTCLAFTFLNPHVYLDTVLLLGTLANQYPGRWWFGAGAASASAVWFVALGVGARWLAPTLARPAAWRVLDAAVAVLMVGVAGSLLLPAVIAA
jgi:L-lysine exporter family protein LysE/ArgO